MKKLKKSRYEVIIGVLLLFAVFGLTIGYATFTQLIFLHGTATFKPNGDVRITSFELTDSSNLDENSETHSYNGMNASFSAEFINVGNDASYYLVYTITVVNDSFYSYDFANSTFTPDVSSQNSTVHPQYSVIGITAGETLPSNSTKTFQIRLDVTLDQNHTGDINIGGDITNEVEQEFIGSLIGSISGSANGDLVNNSLATFTVSVANTYEYNKTINFALGDDTYFSIVDCNNPSNPRSNSTINANDTNTFTFCVKANSGVEFASSPQSVSVFLTCTEHPNSSIGSINLAVPVTIVVHDDDPPVISNVSITKTYGNKGNAVLTWRGTDEHIISKYVIVVNKQGEDPQIIDNVPVSSNPSYTFTNLAENTNYEFIVYGEDEFQNNGSGSVSNPSTTSGEAVTTGTVRFNWTYSVTWHLSGMTTSSGTSNSAEEDKTYSATLNLNNQLTRDWPSNLTITMDGHSGNLEKCTRDTTTCDGYYWNDGTLKIYHVTGNLDITGSDQARCLVEGTKVLLANGKYKNIEDIGYHDLLAVWDYQNGKVTYEYPIWIEQEKKTSSYQKTTLSDGTILKTVGGHAVYDLDKKLFVDVNKPYEFDIGSKIAKIENGKIKPVTVKKIEIIKEDTKYYHVVSTTYYNIIANDILTTDDETILSNLYGFDDNIMWPSSRNNIINDKNNLYKYEDLNGSLPYYMFKGLRAGEAKYLVNLGYLTNEELMYYFETNQSNPDMVKKPFTLFGKRYWAVSVDNNKTIVQEGSTYTLPDGKVKCYLNTSDNKCYKPKDKVKIYYGTHFISK